TTSSSIRITICSFNTSRTLLLCWRTGLHDSVQGIRIIGISPPLVPSFDRQCYPGSQQRRSSKQSTELRDNITAYWHRRKISSTPRKKSSPFASTRQGAPTSTSEGPA
ncbi:hypothetical protein MMC08_009025, partial [Hypocenomyce scalaris]|nr:hypothetical protein [Hypocenomyce scalaris]